MLRNVGAIFKHAKSIVEGFWIPPHELKIRLSNASQLYLPNQDYQIRISAKLMIFLQMRSYTLVPAKLPSREFSLIYQESQQ
jgi:hypothetical protein